MASQSRGRLWALPGSQGLSGAPTSLQPALYPPLGSQSRAHTPLSWRAAATARASPTAPSTSIPPSAWARAREASLAGASNPSSSLGGRPPPPSDASPRKEHAGAAAAAASAAAFERDESAYALRVAVERVAKDVARVAAEATACRLANERALTEMASEVERLACVVADNIKEDGRRSREAVRAAAAQTAGEMQDLSTSVQDALAVLTEAAKAPRRETILPEDARQSRHMQMKSLASDALLQTKLRRNDRGDARGEDAHVGKSDGYNHGEGHLNNTIPLSVSADPIRSSPQEDPETARVMRVPVGVLSIQHAQPVASPLIPRHLSSRQSLVWPQVSEYRMPVPASGQASIAPCDPEDKRKTDGGSDQADDDDDDDDDVFLHDGPLEIHGVPEEHCGSDDGTIAPWEIGVKRDWEPAVVQRRADAEMCEGAEKIDKGSKTKSSPRVRNVDRQISRRRSSRRRSR